MRKLKTSDVFPFARVAKKLGVKDKFRAIAQNAESGKDVWDSGFDLIWELFDAATDTNGEKQIYEFLAGPFEMPAKAISDLDLDQLMEMLKQLAEENNLAGFFKHAAGLMR